MKLFKFVCGDEERVGVFADEQAAHGGRASVDPAYAYLPVEIEELTVPGYTISIDRYVPVTAVDYTSFLATADRQQLREWLDANQVQYVPQWGDQRLREAALEAAEAKKGEVSG